MYRAIAAAISALSKDFSYLYQAQEEKEIQEKKRKEKKTFVRVHPEFYHFVFSVS